MSAGPQPQSLQGPRLLGVCPWRGMVTRLLLLGTINDPQRVLRTCQPDFPPVTLWRHKRCFQRPQTDSLELLLCWVAAVVPDSHCPPWAVCQQWLALARPRCGHLLVPGTQGCEPIWEAAGSKWLGDLFRVTQLGRRRAWLQRGVRAGGCLLTLIQVLALQTASGLGRQNQVIRPANAWRAEAHPKRPMFATGLAGS